jgi:hypothetical protein
VHQAFRWEKLGLVYQAPRDGSWRHIYGQAPTVVRIGDRIRAFFAVRQPRDAAGLFKADMSWVDVSVDDPTTIVGEASGPLVPFGRPGTFDEHGLMPSCAVWAADTLRLYYCGWMRLVGVPYAVSIGLAESHDGGATFVKAGEGPLLGRTLQEPYQENGAIVIEDAGTWHMWYGSGTDWIADAEGLEAIYVIKYAHSTDGITWVRDARPLLPEVVEHECQARPNILKIGSRWHMWFSYRYGLAFRNAERGYRIGYAWSDDLVTWHRDDALSGIDVSPSGWDSETVAYPCIFPAGDQIYMYYNGNDFGEGGFGCARLIR